MQDITFIEFQGDLEKGRLIISNDLLNGNFETGKLGDKQYFYVFLDGNFNYQILNRNIWLSQSTIVDLLGTQLKADFVLDDKLTMLS